MTEESPPVTVGMPVYNGMPHLPQAVESILEQSLNGFEFLILDGGSDDGSAKYLKSLEDPRVTVVTEERMGLGATLNRSLEICETPYYARMDADDIARSTRLEKQLDLLRSDPELVMTGSQIEFLVDGDTVPATRVPRDHARIYELLKEGSAALCHPALMYRTDVAESVGYRIGHAGEDFDFFLRMAEEGKVTNHSHVLLHYRIHDDSLVVKNHAEVVKGIAYASRCAECRQAGRPEPTFEEFAEEWENRPGWRKLQERLATFSSIQYRRSIIDEAQSRTVRSFLRKAIAGALQPRRALKYVSRKLARSNQCSGTG